MNNKIWDINYRWDEFKKFKSLTIEMKSKPYFDTFDEITRVMSSLGFIYMSFAFFEYDCFFHIFKKQVIDFTPNEIQKVYDKLKLYTESGGVIYN